MGVATQAIDPMLAQAYSLPVDHGLFVGAVDPNGPAAKAGIKHGDIITAFDGKPVNITPELLDAILSKKPGDQAQVTFYSGAKQQTVAVTLAELPASQG